MRSYKVYWPLNSMTDFSELLDNNADQEYRFCKRCDDIKHISEFQKLKRKEGKGFRYRCKKCQKEDYNKLDYKYGKSGYHRLKKYGINGEQFLELIKSQNGQCKICKNSLGEGRQTHVDHCHKFGNIRGILCQTCNTKLGWAEKHIHEILSYLKLNDNI